MSINAGEIRSSPWPAWTQARWSASHRVEPGRLCLEIKDLAAPNPSEHTLAVGYTATLQGAVFDDGRTTRTFILYRFKGRPDKTELEKCVPIQEVK